MPTSLALSRLAIPLCGSNKVRWERVGKKREQKHYYEWRDKERLWQRCVSASDHLFTQVSLQKHLDTLFIYNVLIMKQRWIQFQNAFGFSAYLLGYEGLEKHIRLWGSGETYCKFYIKEPQKWISVTKALWINSSFSMVANGLAACYWMWYRGGQRVLPIKNLLISFQSSCKSLITNENTIS